MMKHLYHVLLALSALVASVAVALPSPSDLAKARGIVTELMADDLAALKAGKKTAVEVADAALALVSEAETDAAKYLLLKSALSLAVRGKDYEKAADIVERLQTSIADLPAAEVVSLVQTAAKGLRSREAPRLFALYRAAQQQIAVDKERAAAETAWSEAPESLIKCRTYAEWCVYAGDWAAAKKAFPKLGAAFAQAVRTESADPAAAADFWWTYDPVVRHASVKAPTDSFRRHAAELYEKGIAAGTITGLKKTLAEKRIKQVADRMSVQAPAGGDVPVAPRGATTPAPSAAPQRATAKSYAQRGLVAQWDGLENAGPGQHREQLKAWKDLKGAHDIKLTSAASVTENAIACSGATHAGVIEKAPFKKGQVVAMDLAVDFISNAGNSCFFSTGTQASGFFDRTFGVSHGGTEFVFGTSSLGPRVPGRYSLHFDFQSKKCYFNGEPRPVKGPGGLNVMPGRGEDFYIGGYLNSGLKCKIHALRIYNRKLTEAEIQQHARLDAERFGF